MIFSSVFLPDLDVAWSCSYAQPGDAL